MSFPIHYPASLDLKVLLTDGNGLHAVATIEFAVGRHLSKEDIRERIDEFVAEQMPDGFRLMTKREAWDYAMQEATGTNQRFAMPGQPEFDE